MWTQDAHRSTTLQQRVRPDIGHSSALLEVLPAPLTDEQNEYWYALAGSLQVASFTYGAGYNASGLARLVQRGCLCMRAAAGMRPAASDHAVVFDEDAAHAGIGIARRARTARQPCRRVEPARVSRR